MDSTSLTRADVLLRAASGATTGEVSNLAMRRVYEENEREVERVVQVLGAEEFLGTRYDLRRNCNHFVERLIEELVDESLEENRG